MNGTTIYKRWFTIHIDDYLQITYGFNQIEFEYYAEYTFEKNLGRINQNSPRLIFKNNKKSQIEFTPTDINVILK